MAKAIGIKKTRTPRTKLPSGFVEARSALDGFFTRNPGNTVIGNLRGSFVVNGKFGAKTVYRIEVTEGTTEVGDDGEFCEAGDTIGLDETGYTKVLGEMASGTRVFVGYIGKDPDKDGKRGAHRFSVGKAE